jgi:Ca2+/H+ antiporter
MLLVYISFLIFQLKTHAHLFEDDEEEEATGADIENEEEAANGSSAEGDLEGAGVSGRVIAGSALANVETGDGDGAVSSSSDDAVVVVPLVGAKQGSTAKALVRLQCCHR